MSKVSGAVDPLSSLSTLQAALIGARLLLLVGLASWSCSASAAQQQSTATQPPQDVTILSPGSVQAIHLAVGEARTYKIILSPQQSLRLVLTQGEHFQKLILHGPRITGSTRTNDSGSGASIPSTLTNASPAGSPASEYTLAIQSYHSNESSEGSLDLSPASFSLPEAQQRATAEDLFYDAEYLRRSANAKQWPHANDEFQQSLNLIQPLKDQYFTLAILTEQSRLLLFRLNDYVGAQRVAAQAAAVAAQLDTNSSSALYSDRSILTLKALCLKTLGSADYYLSDYPSAILHSNQSLAIYQQLNDLYWEGILRGNLAYVYFESGDTPAALETAARASAIADQVHDEYGRVYTLEALGSIHLARDEFDQAYDSYQQALTLTRKTPYPAIEALIWRGLGRFYQEVGKADLAEDAYQQAVTSAKKASDTAALLEITSELAALERSQGKLKAAHTAYDSGIALSGSSKLSREAVLLQSGLALTLAAEKKPREGIQQAGQAAALAQSIGYVEGEANATRDLAQLYLGLKDLKSARADYSHAAQLYEGIQDRVQTAHALAQLARIDVASDLQLAQTEEDHALDLIESTRVLVPGRELRTSYFADQQGVYAFGIELMIRLNRAYPNRHYVDRAFQIAEMARARSLLDQSSFFAEAANFSTTTPSPETASCELHLAAAYQRLHDLNVSDENANYRITRTQNEIQGQLAICDGLAGTAQSAKRQPETSLATLDSLQHSLSTQHASLIEYWLGDAESCLWYITAHGVKMLPLPPRRRLEAQVQSLTDSILARQSPIPGEDLAARTIRLEQSDRRAGDLLLQMGKLLLGPASGHPAGVLYIVPDGALASLPFAALTPQFKETPILLQGEVIEEPSSSVLLHLLDIHANSGGHPSSPYAAIAIFADPVYAADDERLPHQPAHLSQTALRSAFVLPELARLPASRAEADSIASLASGSSVETHIGFDASSHAILSTDWSRYQVMHLALHALIGQSPAFTGIAFSMFGRSGRTQNGMLWLNQIYRLKGAPGMVFLSACSTAAGKEIPGEGIDSLANAFLSHGSQSVIASLWSVEDQASSQLVRDFYYNLLTLHLPPGASLRRAQLSFVHSTQHRSPLYWAAFQLEGLPGN
ncbi:CHAT domain-containing tetratricopeptide repeat protein [Granulicella tundricola]|uniref:Tetratricopeptide TPR_1 repeat-containing protein n=1 Tax=Granulicella tundricola (strain ATCC BAA-1859 / DSM 23138 / MP5ACTX9) TaxID=1198114 RepID=E8X5Y6_GRATM|nr:CHAT domain-containing protein [Granulicella tundricola]ADW70870.1 Tetratricopeptide TPR_1 repeat-containing protein [Granulicella tundricola MP5ACTX9]